MKPACLRLLPTTAMAMPRKRINKKRIRGMVKGKRACQFRYRAVSYLLLRNLPAIDVTPRMSATTSAQHAKLQAGSETRHRGMRDQRAREPSDSAKPMTATAN